MKSNFKNRIINGDSLEELKKIPINFGTEIDRRSNNSDLILSHDPFLKGDKLENYFAVPKVVE